MTGWRVRELVGEAWRNATISAWRSLSLAVVVAGVAGVLTIAELDTTTDLVSYQNELVGRGSNVGVVSHVQPSLPVPRCVQLAEYNWIVSAGSVTVDDPVEVTSAPGTAFQTYRATGGALRVWNPELSYAAMAEGLVVGSAAAAELGIREGSPLELNAWPTRRVGAVVDTSFRNPNVDRGFFEVAAPTGLSNSCWVEFETGALETGLQYLEVLFADVVPGPEVRPYMQTGDFARNAPRELLARPQARAWFPLGAVIAAMSWLAFWFRRSEIGFYRAVGTRTSALFVLIAVETWIVVLPAGTSGFLWAITFHAASSDRFPGFDQISIAARSVASALLVIVIVTPLVAAWLGRRHIAALLKDR